MKILFVHMGYWPYMAATNRALTALAEYLAAAGNEIHVICTGPNPRPEDPNAPANQKNHNGVYLHRIPDLNFPKFGINWKSPINIIRFFFIAGITSLFWSYKFDLVITLDFPPIMGIWGSLIQIITLGKTRHVCWIMDMLTESRFQLGIWRSDRIHHRLIDYLHTAPYRYAALNVVLGNCMGDRLQRRQIDSAKVKTIGIWHYSSLINPLPFGTLPSFFNNELSEKFIVMYSGYGGAIHTFDALKETMIYLKDEHNIQFVFVGNYPALLEIETFAITNSIKNFYRYDPVEWEDLNVLLAAANLHLITLRDDMQGICVPSKLYGAMAAGRPVIFVGPSGSQSARDVIESDAGFVVQPSDSQKLISTISHLANNPRECQRLGNNARRSFLRNHDYSVCCSQWEQALVDVLKPKKFTPL